MYVETKLNIFKFIGAPIRQNRILIILIVFLNSNAIRNNFICSWVKTIIYVARVDKVQGPRGPKGL